MRLLLYTILLFLVPCTGCRASHVSPADRKVLDTFWTYAEKQQLSTLPVNERVPLIARFFLGTPYESNTLNVCREELPVINLRALDCVTFVENVLALAFLEKYDRQATDAFVRNIVRLRYRDAEIVDYTSRLHYSTDWLHEMQKAGWATDLTQFAGGIEYKKSVSFMSAHRDKYPQLAQDNALLEKIKHIEDAINKRTHYYIPKEKVGEACARIKNGDIILITTTIKGLDTSHLGFAWKQDGKTYLIHASSNGKKVMVTETPLQEYMADISSQSGIMIARAARIRP